MNIFVLSLCPIEAAQFLCDKHIPKLIVECFQMLGSAQRRHGVNDAQMPLTSKGTPLLGGYHHHPATRFTGETRENYYWVCRHALAMLSEYQMRFKKIHACTQGIIQLSLMGANIPEGALTDFAQCMPDRFKTNDAVFSYRVYYFIAKGHFAKWEKGRKKPDWFKELDDLHRSFISQVHTE